MAIRHHLKRHLTKKKILLAAAGATVLVVLIGLVAFALILNSLPSLELLQNRQVSQSTKIYDRTGNTLLYEIYGEERRTVIPLDQIPEQVKQATISIEDANFYEHSAIDVRGLTRAIFNNIGLLFREGGIIQGGSTITQQLAKKAFLTDERTPIRKLKELVIAYRLEKAYTKDQILEFYLNQIPYGNNAYGIESAAQTFFQRSVSDLTLAQAALLASLPNAPSYYSPFGSHIKELMARKDLTLKRMEQSGYITEEEMLSAQQEELVFNQLKNLEHAPHFVLDIKQYLEEQYGEDFVRRSGLRVVTTLDSKLQEIAEKAVAAGAERNTELYKGTNAALVAQDPKTGQILALVGSRNFFDKEIDGQFNVASQGLRQPGSALKPFVYLAALELGYPPETVLFDTETEFNTTGDPEKSYKPRDYDERYRGPVNFRNALAQSINVPAVKALYLVGVNRFLDLLGSFGITTLTDRSRFGLSLVLGGGEVYLQELVGAYSVLAQEGVHHEQHMILSVTDQEGKVLEEYRDTAQPVIDAEYPRMINDMLSDVSARAPLFANSLNLTVFPGYDVALKTGTTNDYRDAWSVGYTPSLVAGVWAGNNDNTPMERRGGSILAAVPILSAFLRDALPTTPEEPFAPATPTMSDKPMLNGEHIATYQSGGRLYQHVHDILYYVSRSNPLGPVPANPERDPQFTNWEQGVLAWAAAAIPGFIPGTTYNQPLPSDATLVDTVGGGAGAVIITSPTNGSFINGNQITVSAQVQSQKEIMRLEVYFNGSLVDSRTGSLGVSPSYQASLGVGAAQAQNTLKIVATDTTNTQISSEVVVYR